MSNLIYTTILIGSFFVASSFDAEFFVKPHLKNEGKNEIIYKDEKNEIVYKIKESKKEIREKQKNFENFEKALIFSESSNVIDTVNHLGCVGLYQFCKVRAKDLGVSLDSIKKMSKKDQRKLFKKHIKMLKKAIGKKDYKKLKAMGWSDGSIIAVAHLGGVNGLKKHAGLKKHSKFNKYSGLKGKFVYNPSDGYSTLLNYKEKFKEYDNFLILF